MLIACTGFVKCRLAVESTRQRVYARAGRRRCAVYADDLAGLSPAEAQAVLQRTDRLIKSVPEVASVFGKAGRAETATDPAPLTMLETIIQFKPEDQWREGMTREKIVEELQQKLALPGLTAAWVPPILNRINMQVSGIRTPLGRASDRA